VARPDLIITECRFLIYSMPNDIRKLQLKFDRDLTSSSPSIDSTSTTWKRASGNTSKSLTAIQWSDQKLWLFRTFTQAWRDQTSASSSIDSSYIPCKRASGNSSKSLTAFQRSDQKLWPFRIVTKAWRDQTSSSPSIDSTSTPCKRASGKLQ